MRNLLYIAVLSISLWSCGGGDDPAPTPVNTAPTVPSLTYPTNNLLCIDNVVNFQWNASTDAEGGVITYEIQVAKNTLFSPVSHTQTSTTTSKSITLEKGIAYYWRVKATDSKNASSNYSSTFNLYTEGVGITNHLPFSPVLVSPALNKVVKPADYSPITQLNVILEWTASDVDTSDTLTYDVYFGTETEKNNLPKVSLPNHSVKTYSTALSASTKYYWKVTVKDNYGGQTIGQVWSFTTD
ncbi:MAG: SusE domain-containing protein [Lutibacter sp.]|nr:SusE domain-containing protein [Lutibacter sp.]